MGSEGLRTKSKETNLSQMNTPGGTNENSGVIKLSKKEPPPLPGSRNPDRTRVCWNFETLSIFFCKTIISRIKSNTT